MAIIKTACKTGIKARHCIREYAVMCLNNIPIIDKHTFNSESDGCRYSRK